MKCWKCNSKLIFVPARPGHLPFFKCPKCRKPRIYVYVCFFCESPQTFYSKTEYYTHLDTAHGRKRISPDRGALYDIERNRKIIGVIHDRG